MWGILIVFAGAFGIDRSYSYSATLGKHYNKGKRPTSSSILCSSIYLSCV